MHSASFFKTKRSRALPVLKSKQIKVFWHLDDINKVEKMRFFKIDAARRATQTKMGNRIILKHTIEIRTFVKNGRRTPNCRKNTCPKSLVEHRTPEK